MLEALVFLAVGLLLLMLRCSTGQVALSVEAIASSCAA